MTNPKSAIQNIKEMTLREGQGDAVLKAILELNDRLSLIENPPNSTEQLRLCDVHNDLQAQINHIAERTIMQEGFNKPVPPTPEQKHWNGDWIKADGNPEPAKVSAGAAEAPAGAVGADLSEAIEMLMVMRGLLRKCDADLDKRVASAIATLLELLSAQKGDK